MIKITATKIIKIKGDWQEVLNDCRSTVNKAYLNKEPSTDFKKRILISEHSPIRDISIKWMWEGIKSWISVHFVRHKWECFVSTQRTDRTGIDRNVLRQDMPVNFTGDANIQALIDTSRKRLCYQASAETRQYMEDLKRSIHEIEPEVADILVPNCIYRCGCPEQMGAHCDFFENLITETPSACSIDIQKRYDAYNKWFYDREAY